MRIGNRTKTVIMFFVFVGALVLIYSFVSMADNIIRLNPANRAMIEDGVLWFDYYSGLFLLWGLIFLSVQFVINIIIFSVLNGIDDHTHRTVKRARGWQLWLNIILIIVALLFTVYNIHLMRENVINARGDFDSVPRTLIPVILQLSLFIQAGLSFFVFVPPVVKLRRFKGGL